MNLSTQPLWLVIVSLGVTGSVIGAVVAAVASRLSDRSRRRFELQRWRADCYLGPKLEALRKLHEALVRSHYEINMRAKARMPQNLQEYRDLDHVEVGIETALVPRRGDIEISLCRLHRRLLLGDLL